MANIEIFGTLVRNDGGTNRDKIVQSTQVEGGYFVCSTLPTQGTWATGQLCYCQEDSKFYQYNGTTWVEKVFGITSEASQSAAGLMSSTDKKKLDTLALVATSGSYNDLSNKPTIPTVNNATLTIQKNGATVETFTANSATDVTANITVPTKVSDLTNDSGFKTTDTNTTYDLAASKESDNGNVKLNLTAGGSGSGTDSVTIKGSGTTTVTTDANGIITVNSSSHPTALKNPHTLSIGGKSYDGSSAVSITAAELRTHLELSNALHFIGLTTTAITDNAATKTITVDGKSHTAVAGDVVLYNSNEYVFDGTNWLELGDGSSHALKTLTITAGNGLTGGGTLTADITLDVGEGNGITVGDDVISAKAGNGITVDTNGINHADTSSQASLTTGGRTYINKLTLDGYGHVTGLETGTESVTDTNQKVKVGNTTFGANDTINFIAGDNITITPDTTKDTITISATDTTYSEATTSEAGLMSTTDKTKLDGYSIGANGIYYIEGTNGDSVNIWLGTNSNITEYFVGLTIAYKTPTVAYPPTTLNINGLGAVTVVATGNSSMSSNVFSSGDIILLTYTLDNGTPYWKAVSRGVDNDNNTTYTNAALGQGYATSSNSGTARTASLSGYYLLTGGIVAVKFAEAVPASATLNINSKGAKSIHYRGNALTSGIIEAGDIATFIYNGSQYHLLSIDRWQNDIKNIQSTIGDISTVLNSILTKTNNIIGGATHNG